MSALRVVLLTVLLGLCPLVAQAQQAAPLFETRAVWFTAALGDGAWPPRTADAAGQAEALRRLIRACHAMGLNTFIFQVTANGDAFYESTRLPWTVSLNGPGINPGFDPLAVAVEETHRLGMELHAWINVFWVGDLTTLTQYGHVTGPAHVLFAHPDWVQANGYLLWLDPGVAEARKWLVGNVIELVEKYDLDAIHFDYIRYPGGGLKDDVQRFLADPRGFTNLEDWRRDNVTRFVQDATAAVRARKPWVKMAATPIGNYKPHLDWPALWGFSDTFQESRRWLAEGWHDYLAPQLYWSIGTTPEPGTRVPSPDYQRLAKEWAAEAHGRPVFAGIAAYKPAFNLFSADELPRQIDLAREAGMGGQVFFRYDHLYQYRDLVAGRYRHQALPYPMRQRPEAAAPRAPTTLQVRPEGDHGAALSWSAATGTLQDPLRGYAILRRAGEAPVPERAEDLLTVVDAGTTTFRDAYASRPAAPYVYRVVALSRLGLVSPPSSPAAAVANVGVEPTPAADGGLEALFPNPATDVATAVFTLEQPGRVEIILHDLLGRRVAVGGDGWRGAGRHEVRLSVAHLPPGLYLCTLRVGGAQYAERLVVTR